jgi:hypothetical protein
LSIHPGGDPEHVFAPPGFRFVFSARYGLEGPSEVETYELWGRGLIDAVERNPPELFRRARRLAL